MPVGLDGLVSNFVPEMWGLFAGAIVMTILRMIARVWNVGWKKLDVDDYLVCVALIPYAAETALAHVGGELFLGDKEAPTAATISSLPVDDFSVQNWIKMQKLHLASWPMYLIALWMFKLSLLFLYKRLTKGLVGSYHFQIRVGFFMVGISWIVAMLVVFLTCRPITTMWTHSPYPPDHCQAANSRPIIWTCYVFNIITDLWLIAIPFPMLWETKMKLWKKIGIGLMFSCSLLTVFFATMRCVLVALNPAIAQPLAASWAIRETYVASIITNSPMSISLITSWFKPSWIGLSSSKSKKHSTSSSSNNSDPSSASYGKKGSSSSGSGASTAQTIGGIETNARPKLVGRDTALLNSCEDDIFTPGAWNPATIGEEGEYAFPTGYSNDHRDAFALTKLPPVHHQHHSPQQHHGILGSNESVYASPGPISPRTHRAVSPTARHSSIATGVVGDESEQQSWALELSHGFSPLGLQDMDQDIITPLQLPSARLSGDTLWARSASEDRRRGQQGTQSGGEVRLNEWPLSNQPWKSDPPV